MEQEKILKYILPKKFIEYFNLIGIYPTVNPLCFSLKEKHSSTGTWRKKNRNPKIFYNLYKLLISRYETNEWYYVFVGENRETRKQGRPIQETMS